MQNGGYVQPAPLKRQFRDPYGDWWDKQERRNYGEPIHEDYDQLGMFTAYEYTWVSPRTGLIQIGAFIATFLGVCYLVKATYPDRPSFPREFEGGLERELGGSGAVRVSPEAIGTWTSPSQVSANFGGTGESTRGSGTIPGGRAGLSRSCTCRYRPKNWTGLEFDVITVITVYGACLLELWSVFSDLICCRLPQRRLPRRTNLPRHGVFRHGT